MIPQGIRQSAILQISTYMYFSLLGKFSQGGGSWGPSRLPSLNAIRILDIQLSMKSGVKSIPIPLVHLPRTHPDEDPHGSPRSSQVKSLACPEQREGSVVGKRNSPFRWARLLVGC